MSLSGRGARRQPAEPTASTFVRTLDVYPVQPSTAKASRSSPVPPNTAYPSATAATALAGARKTSPAPPKRRYAATGSAKTATSPSPPSPSTTAHTVTEEDYHFSPQAIQRVVQENLAAQVRSLLENRLKQRLQQARQVEAERAAQLRRQAAVIANANKPLQDGVDAGNAAGVWQAGVSGGTVPHDVSVSAAAAAAAQARSSFTPPVNDDSDPQSLPFTTARLSVAAAAAAAAAAPPPQPVDPAAYDVTLDAHPYSAIELVRVHRLKGIAHHNRGLFAGLGRRSFTTRSGHLVVNPDLDGKGRVRSAVSGRVWEHQQQQRVSSHHDATSINASSSIASPSRVASSNRMAPPRLVMKVVVGEGQQASFMWTEEDSQYDAAGDEGRPAHGGVSAHSLTTPLSTAVCDVLDHKYGKALSESEKAEAARRLRARRQREQASGAAKSDAADDGTPDKRTADQLRKKSKQHRSGSGGKTGSAASARSGRSSASANSASSAREGAAAAAGGGSTTVGVGAAAAGVVGGSSSSPSPADKYPHLQHLMPAVLAKPSNDGEAAKDGRGQHGAAEGDGANTSVASHLIRESTAVPGAAGPLGIEGGGRGSRSSSGSGSGRASSRRPGRQPTSTGARFSASEMDRTMSVHEAEERQHERQERAEQAATATPTQEEKKGTTAAAGGAKTQAGNGPNQTSTSPVNDASSAAGRRADHNASSTTSDKQSGTHYSPPPFPHRGTTAVNMLGDLGLLKHGTSSTPSSKGPRHTPESATLDGDGGSDFFADLPGRTTRPAGSRRKAAQANDVEQKQLDTFLEHFPEAETHVQLRREAKTILDEFEDLWDEDGPISERPFPLPQFANQEFHFPIDDDDGTDDDPARLRQHTSDQPGGNNAATLHSRPPEAVEEPVVGFDIDTDALQAKFRAEATEECAALAATRDALLAEVVAQRQLISDFGDDIHFLSVGCSHNDLTAEQYAIELTREVNVYARQNHLRFFQVAEDDEALQAERLTAEEQESAVLGFLERFGKDRVPTRDVGCQVSDADLCYVDAAVRSTEAQLESLFHHEKALLGAVRLATVAVANILSFHASLEMESTCHECFFVFDKPRTLWPCGHTFCHACLASMYNARGDLICAECGSVAEVGYTPNMPIELIANYQTVYTRADADTRAAANTTLSDERDAQTIEGVLRSLLNDLVATQHSWTPAAPQI